MPITSRKIESKEKRYAKKCLDIFLFQKDDISKLVRPSQLTINAVNNLLKSSANPAFKLDAIVTDPNLKNRIYHAYEKFSKKSNKTDDFKLALEELILDELLKEIKSKFAGREDATLINDIIKRLENESWSEWRTQEFSITERIHCAKELDAYLKLVALGPDTPISDKVLEKYPLLCSRFGKEIKNFNDNIRRPKIAELVKPKFYKVDTSEEADSHNDKINSFIYLNDAINPKLYFINSNKIREEIVITDIDKDQLSIAIATHDLSKLKKLLGAKFPQEINLELTNKAVKKTPRFDYLRAKIGGITKYDGSKYKSAGDKARERARREDTINQSTLNSRVDSLRGATALCNQVLVDYGFAKLQKEEIGLEIYRGADELDVHVGKTNKQKQRFILHIDENGNIKGISYLFYINAIPIIKEIEVNPQIIERLGKDLIFIATGKVFGEYQPSLNLRDLCLRNHKETPRNEINVHIENASDDLINFIVSETGFVPRDILQDQYVEMEEIGKLVSEFESDINTNHTISEQKKQEYKNFLNTIRKISTLPHASFKTSESVIPRYKCKEILTKLRNKFAVDTSAPRRNLSEIEEVKIKMSEEYFRSSYKLYEYKNGIPSDAIIQNSENQNPRFYYSPKTQEIAYVDAFGAIHKSKIQPRIHTGMDIDYYANAALDTSPEKLSNILSRKTKDNNNAYTLDSEEVFKYISLKVEDKDKAEFKMGTVNEELEGIVADEVATTTEIFKKICIAALSAALAIVIVLVPGVNFIYFAALSIGISYFPTFFDSLALGAYKDALRNVGMAGLFAGMAIGLMTMLAFIPGLNFFSAGVSAGGAMIYVTLAIASLTTAFYLSSTINSASRHPKAKEANRELVNLKEQIKAFTKKEEPPIEPIGLPDLPDLDEYDVVEHKM